MTCSLLEAGTVGFVLVVLIALDPPCSSVTPAELHICCPCRAVAVSRPRPVTVLPTELGPVEEEGAL